MNIKNATILITERCNSKCFMCSIWKQKECFSEMTPMQYREFFGRPDFSGLKDVNISGGEATLRNDIADVTEAILKGKHLDMFFLSTNGTNPSGALDCLRAAQKYSNLIYLCVSIDGDRQTNMQVRGIDSYEIALKTIEICKQWNSNIVTNISLTLTPRNTEHEVLEYVRNLAVRYKSTYSFRFAYNNEFYFHNNAIDLAHSNEKKNMVMQFIKDYTYDDSFMKIQYEYLRTGKIDLMMNDDNVCCGAGEKFVLVKPNGDVYPCINSNHLIGDYENGIYDGSYIPGQYEKCPCCVELCVWPNISWGNRLS